MEKELLEKLYLIEKLSQREIAKKLDCSQSTIRHYLKKYKIRSNYSRAYYAAEGKKTCPHCKIEKHLTDFNTRKGENLPSSWCKRCCSDRTLEKQRASKQKAVDYKGGECQICGFKEYAGALEFHHLNPKEKDFQFSHFPTWNDITKAELDKCVLLCANCHRMTHAGLTKFSK